jgi:hypothetical protein
MTLIARWCKCHYLEVVFRLSAESWFSLQANYNRSALNTAREQLDVSQIKRLYTPPSLE